jgi:Adenylate and Guanylate cyclase catalytic domain
MLLTKSQSVGGCSRYIHIFNCKLYCSGVVVLVTTVFVCDIFQVETIGDCYVAVAGLPDPRPDHAVVMARFAQECLIKMNVMTKQLETTLGPGTRTVTRDFHSVI